MLKLIFFVLGITTLFANDPLPDLMTINTFPSHSSQELDRLKHLSQHFELYHPFQPSDVPIDLLIPVVAKDLDMLELVVTHARKNIMHPIRAIYIVAPNEEQIVNQARALGCHFVDETIALPIQIHDIDYFPYEIDRRGWIFQQLLKLSSDDICESEHVLILDSDTLLVRPQAFIQDSRTILNCADEYHASYFDCYERILTEKTTSPFSFICHHMLFERSKLKQLKTRIEAVHQKKWYQAIVDSIDKNTWAGFSEYETYGNFFISNYPGEFVLLHFFNASMKRSSATNFSSSSLNSPTKSASFHHYTN